MSLPARSGALHHGDAVLHTNDAYLTLDQVAQLAGVSRWQVLRDVHADKLDAYRFGPRTTVVTRDDAREYASSRAKS